jgi:hypothetical protein
MQCADEAYEQPEQELFDQVESSSFLPANQVNLDTEEEQQVELGDEFESQLGEGVQAELAEYQMPSGEDMFENVYSNYPHQANEFEFQPMYDHVDEITGSDELLPYELSNSVAQPTTGFDFEFIPNEEETHVTSDYQMSLRNSLLRLRQTRRHLERLIEQSKLASSSDSATTCSSASSTTGSFRTGSTMSLYKQHMLNMSKKPCVYILNEGRCMRSDCRFVHDLKTITCKYWLEGDCIKDENCEFAHEVIHEAKHGNKHKHGKQQTSSKKADS